MMFLVGDQHGAYGVHMSKNYGGGYPLGKGVLPDAHSYLTGRGGPYPIQVALACHSLSVFLPETCCECA